MPLNSLVAAFNRSSKSVDSAKLIQQKFTATACVAILLYKMPEVNPPQQQQPMEAPAPEDVVITHQPVSQPNQGGQTHPLRLSSWVSG